MSRKADKPAKTEPLIWLPLEDAFQRKRARLGSSEDAKDELYAWLRSRESRSAWRRVSANGMGLFNVLRAEFWRDTAYPYVKTDADDGVDYLGIHYPDYSLADEPVEFFVGTVAFEREERLYSAAVVLPSVPGKEPNRTLRPGSAKNVWRTRGSIHDWIAICGEIARRCIDFRTGKLNVPKNVSKFAAGMRKWCDDKFGCQPSDTEMRDAIKKIWDGLLAKPKI